MKSVATQSMFEDLLDVASKQGQPQRLLFLFVGTQEKKTAKNKRKRKGELFPVMGVDKLPSALADFKALAKEADSVSTEWDLVLVACLGLDSGEVPTPEDAGPYLDKMTSDVLEGKDLSGYIAFDRKGNPVEVLAN